MSTIRVEDVAYVRFRAPDLAAAAGDRARVEIEQLGAIDNPCAVEV
jgi:hypothetical protein